jgi:hypothetical protein
LFSLTTEAVRALAPDAGALSAGQSLANPSRWSGLGRSDRALWGRCQGSGKDPYEVSVDLEGPASRCSCPSRKFPCKHAIGLMLIAAGGSGAMPIAPTPDATARWLDGRAARATAAAQPAAAREVDPAKAAADERARARRTATRERRVEQGCEELRLWLADLARRGLADLAAEGPAPFEAAAARLVDAQAGGLARMVRAAGSRVGLGPGVVPGGGRRGGGAARDGGLADGAWADELLDDAGRMFLLLESWGRRDALPEPLLAEVRTLIGWTVREADLPEDAAVADRWLVMGRRHEPDERLLATRTWLRGLGTGRVAVVMDWQPARSVPANEPPVGSVLEGSLAFYPGPNPLRAAIRPGWSPAGEALVEDAARTWRAAIAPYAAALGANPWLERFPLTVADLQPVTLGDWHAYRDAAGETVELRLGAEVGDALHAFAGGRPVTLFGEWDGRAFTPLAAGDGRRWIAIPGTGDVVADEPAGPPAAAVGPADPATADPATANPAWDALRAWALLGTSRAAPDGSLAPLLARLADRSPEHQLLALAASLAVRRRATPVIVPAAVAVPVPAAPDEALPVAPPAAVRALGAAIGSPALVLEWLALADRAGVMAPPELLPRLAAIDDVRKVEGMERVLGTRGAWVAGGATPSVGAVEAARSARDAAAFETILGDPATVRATAMPAPELLAVLCAFRAVDPDRARAWVEAAWPALKGSAARSAMLGALAANPRPGDAPLLDQLVASDGNKQRREEAATIACRVPGSAVRERIEARARALVQRKGLLGKAIEYATPDAGTIAAMERDGMVLHAYLARASLAQRRDAIVVWHVLRVAPSRWAEWLRLSPVDVVTAFMGGKGPAMMLAVPLAGAVEAHRDAVFAEAFAVAVPDGMAAFGADLWPLVPPERREALVRPAFNGGAAASWGHGMALGRALAVVPRPWSNELMTIVRYEVAKTLDSIRPGQEYLVRAYLDALITNVPSGILPEVGRLIDERATASPAVRLLADLAALVAARRSLNDAFAATGGPGGDR